MRYIYLTGILCVLVMCGCLSATDGLYRIDLEKSLKQTEPINLSEYCRSIEYVPIETRTDLLLGQISINNTEYYKGYFYYCEDFGKVTKIFSEDGKLVADKVGVRGRAEGEYSMATSLRVNFITGEIQIVDQNKILLYDRFANFKKAIPLRDSLTRHSGCIYPLGNYFAMRNYSSDERYSLIFIDAKGCVVSVEDKGKKPVALNLLRGHGQLFLSSQYGKLTVLDAFQDTIFTYDENLDKQVKFIVDYGRYKMTPKSTGEDQFIVFTDILENDRLALLIAKANQYGLSFMKKSNKQIYLLYDKIKGTCRVLPLDKSKKWFSFNNDLDNGLPFHPQMIEGNRMIQFINAIDFIDMSKTCSSVKVKQIAATLTEESNPVMVVATLKE